MRSNFIPIKIISRIHISKEHVKKSLNKKFCIIIKSKREKTGIK